ncbi:MAG TPA: ABC transporter permease [Terricaulis sp.]|nr:ABC transporter permease [Terricaulis sp.]HRP11409.1 ABC transporter permease [Terricaulis sp.]
MTSEAQQSSHDTITVIRPDRGWLDLDLGAVWRFRELLGVLVLRDLQVLYKQALLGAGWAILQPVFAVIIFSIIFGYIVKMPSEGVPYPLFAFAGVLPWTYFAEAVRRSGVGLVTDAELVRKIYFPRLIMPLANVVSPLVDFCIAFCVLLVVMAFYGIAPNAKMLLIPFLLAITALLALSIGLWLAPINVRFRDIKHTLPFMIQIWMYATPIVYPLSIVPEQWQMLYSLNPMVGVIEGFRWAVFDKGDPNFMALGMSAGIIVVLLAGGLVFFRRMERTFADVI